MEEEVLNNYKKAQKISEDVMEFARTLVKEDVKVLEVANSIEEEIKRLGGRPAFPVNISLNENAAHYTPDINDTLVLKLDDLVKIDVGVHINGYIWDSAFTICVGKKSHPLIEASEKALSEVIKLIKSGTRVCEISEVVEKTITEFGFKPIRNLSGHGLEQFAQHAPPTIPNGRNTIQEEIKPDSVIAMETFATDGSGWVKESRPILIYRYKQDKPVRMWEARKILGMAKNEFEKLPFARRWLNISPVKMDMALRQLIEVEAIEGYPILKEEGNGLVAQSENTVVV